MKFCIENISGKTATLKLTGPIGYWETSSDAFTRQIDELLDDGVTDIVVYINSPGGAMFDANEIGNQMARFGGAKTCQLGAIAASAASVLSTFFDSVEASSNTQYMLHNPILNATLKSPQDFESNKKIYDNLRQDAIGRYADKSGLSEKVIGEMMDATTWMNAKEAKDKGFVDTISEKNAVLNRTDIDALRNEGLEIPKLLINQITIMKEEKDVAAMSAALAKSDADKVSLLLKIAASKGIPTDGLEALARADYDNTLAFVEGFPDAQASPKEDGNALKSDSKVDANAHNSVVQALADAIKGGESPKVKSWDEMTEAERDALHERDPQAFDTLYNQQFK